MYYQLTAGCTEKEWGGFVKIGWWETGSSSRAVPEQVTWRSQGPIEVKLQGHPPHKGFIYSSVGTVHQVLAPNPKFPFLCFKSMATLSIMDDRLNQRFWLLHSTMLHPLSNRQTVSMAPVLRHKEAPVLSFLPPAQLTAELRRSWLPHKSL